MLVNSSVMNPLREEFLIRHTLIPINKSVSNPTTYNANLSVIRSLTDNCWFCKISHPKSSWSAKCQGFKTCFLYKNIDLPRLFLECRYCVNRVTLFGYKAQGLIMLVIFFDKILVTIINFKPRQNYSTRYQGEKW